jgi:hypothetical protein
MSNVERLQQASVLNPGALSEDQQVFINQELTAEDVEDLIRIGPKVQDHHNTNPQRFGGFTRGV